MMRRRLPANFDAGDVVDAALRPNANIQFQKDEALQTIVRSFGILDDTAAQTDWGWKGAAQRIDLPTAVAAFKDEVTNFPKRIKSLELFGA